MKARWRLDCRLVVFWGREPRFAYILRDLFHTRYDMYNPELNCRQIVPASFFFKEVFVDFLLCFRFHVFSLAYALSLSLVFIIIILCSYLMMKIVYFNSLMKTYVFSLPKSAMAFYLKENVFYINE